MNSAPRAVLLMIACVVLLATGCAQHRYLSFNTRHSLSLARIDKDWPGNPKKKLSMAQQEIYEKRGAPDWIRFWWGGSENFPREYDPRMIPKEQIAQTKQSWIYVRSGDEVIFDTPFSSHSVPISDKLAIVIREGDPEDPHVVTDPTTKKVEDVWSYPSTGKEYHFQDNVLIETRQVNDPMGSAFLKG